MKLFAVGVGALALLSACSNQSCTVTISSSQRATYTYCIELTGSAFGKLDVAKNECTEIDGEYSTTACSTANLYGRCKRNPAQEDEYVIFYYVGKSPTSTAQASCENYEGVWTLGG